jgi:hypothetical protein
MTAEQLLKQAASVVRDRRRTYGQPRDLFERVTARQVAVCLIDVKVARLTHDPRHPDSITDVAGYAAILAELAADA